MPPELIRALALVNAAAPRSSNRALGTLDPKKADGDRSPLTTRCSPAGHDGEFPALVGLADGSGTQSNMNMNEVLRNRASQLLGGARRGAARAPERRVNRRPVVERRSFPTAMSVAAVEAVQPAAHPLLEALGHRSPGRRSRFADIVKIGRTHLQDATPLTLGQEFSGWVASVTTLWPHVRTALPHPVLRLALGGTAVGTGLNAPPTSAARSRPSSAARTGLAVRLAPNKFAALAAHDAIVFAHGALKTLRVADQDRQRRALARLRAALGPGRIRIPGERAGQLDHAGQGQPDPVRSADDALRQVLGNDVAINVAGASGNFEAQRLQAGADHDFLQSTRLLADGMKSFDVHCARGHRARPGPIEELVQRSLMLVTALNPHIGYDKAAKIAEEAHRSGSTLREAAVASGWLSAERVRRSWVVACDMVASA
jgi:fumarate hydratase class II